MSRTFYTPENISANQRIWVRERYSPVKCRECKANILFMKNLHGNYVAVDCRKLIVNESDKKNGNCAVLDELGIISSIGRRVGWPVHICKAAERQ